MPVQFRDNGLMSGVERHGKDHCPDRQCEKWREHPVAKDHQRKDDPGADEDVEKS